jgi:hypothetical protein
LARLGRARGLNRIVGDRFGRVGDEARRFGRAGAPLCGRLRRRGLGRSRAQERRMGEHPLRGAHARARAQDALGGALLRAFGADGGDRGAAEERRTAEHDERQPRFDRHSARHRRGS